MTSSKNLGTVSDCPFCGGLGQLREFLRQPDNFKGYGPTFIWWRVMCRDCGAKTRACDDMNEASNLWTTRSRK